MKRSYFFDLLGYLIAGLAGYYLNSVPIIGLFLSPFILFLLKLTFKKATKSASNGVLVWVWGLWFLFGLPATFITNSFEKKYNIVTPITKKYLSLKKAHGRLADHFPINIDFSKEQAKINLYSFSEGLIQMPSQFTLEIKYFDNELFQNEINRLESLSESPPDGSCQYGGNKPYPYYWYNWQEKDDYQDYKFLLFPDTRDGRAKWTDIKRSRNCDKNHMLQAAINSKDQIIRYFARPF